MAIRGVGIDTVEISRMRDAVSIAERFLENTFSEIERVYCNSFTDRATHYAGTFAAKEAVRKATGELTRMFNEIEIRRNTQGKPEVWTDGTQRTDIHISITHTHEQASAIALYET